MATKTRRQFSAHVKRDLVSRITRGEISVREAAESMQLPTHNIKHWVAKYQSPQENGASSPGDYERVVRERDTYKELYLSMRKALEDFAGV